MLLDTHNAAPPPAAAEASDPATSCLAARMERLAAHVEAERRFVKPATPDARTCGSTAVVHRAVSTTALHLENQRLHAKLRAQTDELRASRARLVEVGDAERRRLERDLHDGAQSRFVAIALHLRRAQAKAPADSEVARMLETAIAELATGLDELRELARGLHPAVLTERGLDAALEVLAIRAPVPVEVRGRVGGRLAGPVEIAAYYAVSEALQNVAKYADAAQVTVDVRHARGRLVVDVTDDGRGGACARAGSGLRGLEDRVGALDGRLEVHSPVGAGTRVHVEIPCDAPRGPR